MFESLEKLPSVVTRPGLQVKLFKPFLTVIQTQTTTAYCRILPTLNHHV